MCVLKVLELKDRGPYRKSYDVPSATHARNAAERDLMVFPLVLSPVKISISFYRLSGVTQHEFCDRARYQL